MNSFVALLSPLALIVPALAAELPGRVWSEAPVRVAVEPGSEPPRDGAAQSAPWRVIASPWQTPVQQQVRVQQRVIIRIGPSSQRAFQQSMARLARQADELEERRTDDCVPIGSIAAVYPSRENRLLLLMRDRRVLSAALDRACSAADFYAGFYVERSEDGQLCSRRDLLQSRAGASCRVARINRLVPARD